MVLRNNQNALPLVLDGVVHHGRLEELGDVEDGWEDDDRDDVLQDSLPRICSLKIHNLLNFVIGNYKLDHSLPIFKNKTFVKDLFQEKMKDETLTSQSYISSLSTLLNFTVYFYTSLSPLHLYDTLIVSMFFLYLPVSLWLAVPHHFDSNLRRLCYFFHV